MSSAHQVVLPPEPRSVRTARRFLQGRLSGDEEAEALAVLLLSELATNAVLHAGTQFTVTVEVRDGHLRAEVTDASDRLPVVKHYEPTAITGRGLRMVADHSDRWGVERRDSGKTVWFELDGDWHDDDLLEGGARG